MAALAGLVPAVALWLLMLRGTHGYFTYTLDDAYIHLNLARSVLGGHYGINPGELSAPSSSIIWPFILAPFALLPSRMFELAPLGLNLVFLAASLAVLFRQLPAYMDRWRAFLVLLLLAWGLNLYGLVFTGMEHSLQLLLVIVALDGYFAPGREGPERPLRFYVALVLLPLLRYEGFAISAPLLVCQFLRGDRVRSGLAGLAAVAGVAGFSLFLYAQGLGVLPSSVLAKSTESGAWNILGKLAANVTDHALIALCAAVLVAFVWRRDRGLGVAVAAASLLHLAVGRFGWFGRYEAYWVCFLAVVALHYVRGPLWALLVAGAPLAAISLHQATEQTPAQSRLIYAQHVQMDRIAALLDRPLALNDIGLVGLHSRHPILDVWGLASREALDLRRANPGSIAWASPLMARKGVKHMMLYDSWFVAPPANWIRVGTLTVLGEPIALGDMQVAFYATDPAAAEHFRAVLRQYNTCCTVDGTAVALSDR